MSSVINVLQSVVSFVSSDAGQAQIAAVFAALLVLAHGLAWLVHLTPTQVDDNAVAKVINALNAVLKFLPRLKFKAATPDLKNNPAPAAPKVSVLPPVGALLLCFAALSASACGNSQIMPRLGNTLMALSDAYRAVCEPPPPEKKVQCADAHFAINEAIDEYSAVNSFLDSDAGAP